MSIAPPGGSGTVSDGTHTNRSGLLLRHREMRVIWKLINSSINPIMVEIDIPDALQCYQERIRMEAPVIKAKLSQKLLVLSQTPLPHIFGIEKLIQ